MLKIRIDYRELHQKVSIPKGLKTLVKEIGIEERKKLGEICIIFVSTERIFQINKSYLGHHYLTDVITFDNSLKGIVRGDLFICYEEVLLNADRYSSKKEVELLRVIIHGILHLCGYGDKSQVEIEKMRSREEFFIQRAEEMKDDGKDGFKL